VLDISMTVLCLICIAGGTIIFILASGKISDREQEEMELQEKRKKLNHQAQISGQIPNLSLPLLSYFDEKKYRQRQNWGIGLIATGVFILTIFKMFF